MWWVWLPWKKMYDQAFALQCQWRSIEDLQRLVTAGKHGRKGGKLKPFENLRLTELQNELQARKVHAQGTLKKDIQEQLLDILKGAHRVPTLLIFDPMQPLSVANIHEYTILDCEPLHTIKGHLLNIMGELPHVLSGESKESFNALVKASLGKDKLTGADLRATAIKAFLLLRRHRESPNNTQLLETVVRISSIFYREDAERSPKMVLQLYNCTWLHHELCRIVFPEPKSISRKKLFGSYLHDLGCHASEQYQIMCLRSVNAECEERLFGQAKAIALRTPSRKPENVITNIFLRLQAKNIRQQSTVKASITKQESIVSKAAKGMPKFSGTVITKEFLHRRMASWQGHMERISLYLLPGKGVWWDESTDGYHFFDSDDNPDYHPQGPKLFHFRHATLQKLATFKKKAWETILEKEIPLPTPFVRLYNSEGNSIGVRTFPPLKDNTSPLSPATTGDSNSLQASASPRASLHCSSSPTCHISLQSELKCFKEGYTSILLQQSSCTPLTLQLT